MATYPKVTGMADLKRAFNSLGKEMPKIARATTNAAAQVVKKQVAKDAPIADDEYTVSDGVSTVLVQPGNIGKNVITKYVKPALADGISEHLVVVRGKAKDGFANRIATLHNYGTEKQAASHFFKLAALKAFAQAVQAAEKRFADRTNAAIKKLSTK